MRSTLCENSLEAFMLMATKRDILHAVDSDQIIDNVA